MAKKNSNFVSVHLPNYLIKDIDNFMIKSKREGSKASFIVKVLNEYLDQQIYLIETSKQLKENKTPKPISKRAKRHELLEFIWNGDYPPEIEKKLFEDYKKLSKEIEKE